MTDGKNDILSQEEQDNFFFEGKDRLLALSEPDDSIVIPTLHSMMGGKLLDDAAERMPMLRKFAYIGYKRMDAPENPFKETMLNTPAGELQLPDDQVLAGKFIITAFMDVKRDIPEIRALFNRYYERFGYPAPPAREDVSLSSNGTGRAFVTFSNGD